MFAYAKASSPSHKSLVVEPVAGLVVARHCPKQYPHPDSSYKQMRGKEARQTSSLFGRKNDERVSPQSQRASCVGETRPSRLRPSGLPSRTSFLRPEDPSILRALVLQELACRSDQQLGSSTPESRKRAKGRAGERSKTQHIQANLTRAFFVCSR